MIRYLACAAALAGLTACTEIENKVDQTGREASRVVVAEIIATRFPQVDKRLITAFTDCVVKNATAAEVRDFARARVSGSTEQTVLVVRAILTRPETRDCLGSPV